MRRHATRMSRRYKITIAYDGTAYCGYQRQGNGISVQQRVEEALEYVCQARTGFHGCSRTDSGVHAKGFVGYSDIDKPIPPANFVRAMNARLPPDIRVMRAAIASRTFHAQHDVKGKEYRYFVYNAPILPPQLYPYWEHEHAPLDLAAMQDGAARFVGTHDFKSFSSISDRIPSTTVRDIYSFVVKKTGPRVVFSVKARGFLYKQVRAMVGFLLQVGRGAEPPEAVTQLLEAAGTRTARIPSAPGRGLFLWRVWYK